VRQEFVERRIEQPDGDGQPRHDPEDLLEIPRWAGRSLASAVRRPFSLSARIIWRTFVIRSASKNICSVRQRPIPSAPNSREMRQSFGVSALVRTRSRLTLSAQAMRVPKSPTSSGCTVGTEPSITSPVEPSIVIA
jgi:hypothetical protein